MSCFIKNKIYLVFGVGITGKATISFLKKQNKKFYVACDNSKELKDLFIDGTKLDEKFKLYNVNEQTLREKNINFLILSPSVHAQSKPHNIVIMSHKLNIKIIADIDLFYCYLKQYNRINCTNKKIVAITGTNGKSTTTALTAFLFNKMKCKAIACGNIGLNMLSLDVKKYDFFVVEMSSYNLFLSHYALFYSGVLLNITEDHLEYHGTMKNYVEAKFKALKKAHIKIVCIDDKYSFRATKMKNKENKNNITFISTKQILKNGWSWNNNVFYRDKKEILKYVFKNLQGRHNVENILCSVSCVAKTLGIHDDKKILDIFKKVKLFHGLPHRIQLVKKIDGIEFINDSKATNADSTQKALNTFSKDDIYLIAGGQRKTAGFYFLKNDLKNVKCVFLIGEASKSFAEELTELNIKHKICGNMKKAILLAFKEAKNNIKKNNNCSSKKRKIVLLSPLCASWDQYKNFEDRGNDFVKIVNKI